MITLNRRPSGPPARRRPAVAALMTVCALLLAACGSADEERPAAAPDPGTGHLHGLGVDPADGTVYAAGHLGVFRLAGSKAVRVADRFQDTMGFTVTGPRTFLASGHPSPADRTAASPHLGLIRSTDAGSTWTTVSAEGEADFHSLQKAGEVLYGFDSQSSQVWVSSDRGSTWDRRARLPVGDLAAHAGKPQRVWATTADGLQVSEDGGGTFRPVPGSPALVAIDSPEDGVLIGIGPDGRVLRGTDGRTWTVSGRLPRGAEPTLLSAVTADRLLAADSADVVYESKDGGRSWAVLHRPSPA
ncbi:F510_1955 family glycosylhydrolase [Streptomyces peucetius]|uniref:Exo-alpha-sialidase n=1 Tax=Streptomyces peucetius TaxID=1950 RepID=A0ABY6I0Y5_STRPE|nr:exo-alpha-sialidase [Streptomyces peucetius]UYQ60628.1 exo-alpha-sialidase [Streptomyces peucetius]